ncbi:hypothetical protein QP223_10965, partial [Streptococcus agalactiae]|nr:hypothetical protein [Streptococcus agalactiae]
LDDSRSNVVSYEGASPKAAFGEDNINAGGWRIASRDHEETDFYFLGYAHNYKQAMRDFFKLTGPQPLLPRWALGNWWSRYFAYEQNEYLQLHDR